MNYGPATTDSGDGVDSKSQSFFDRMIDAILKGNAQSEKTKPSETVSSEFFEEEPIAAHLLVETALVDTAGLAPLKYRQVEQLKKDLAAINTRLLAAYQKLKLDCKVRHATKSLSRITNESNSRHGTYPHSGQEELEVLVLEIQDLTRRRSDSERALNQHYNAILNIANTRLTMQLQELTERQESSNASAEMSTEEWKNRCQQLEQEMEKLLINFEGLTMEAIEKERGVLNLPTHGLSFSERPKPLSSHNWNLSEPDYGQPSSINFKESSWISQDHVKESLKEEFSWLIRRLRTDNLKIIKDLKVENQNLRNRLAQRDSRGIFDA